MDHLKLFAKDDNDLEGLLQTVKKVSDDIGMSFGLDKLKLLLKKGSKLEQHQ